MTLFRKILNYLWPPVDDEYDELINSFIDADAETEEVLA